MDRTELGRWGEAEAAAYLEATGWRILGRNVRFKRGEVDLVVWMDRILAFVEVKTRRGVGFGHPLDAITAAKRREIARVARGWMRTADLPPVNIVRFDAVSVLRTNDGPPEIQHIPDAWRLE